MEVQKSDKKKAHQALVMDDRSDYNPRKMKESNRDREIYPPLSSSDEEFFAILDSMLRL